MNNVCFCLSIASRSPPTTPSGCGAKTHNLRTVTLGLCLAFHMLSCVTFIKSLNLSLLIWSMGTMMIIPPLDACVPVRRDGPERASWNPESEKVWIILPPGEMEIFCLEIMAAIPKDKYWLKANDIYLWTLPRTLTQPMLLFPGPQQERIITGSDCSLLRLTSQRFLVNYF